MNPRLIYLAGVLTGATAASLAISIVAVLFLITDKEDDLAHTPAWPPARPVKGTTIRVMP